VRWLADECIDGGLVAHLRHLGHDVLYMAEVAPSANDADVMAHAQGEARLLLTEDKDFGDLVFRRGVQVPGLVLLRVDPAQHTLKRHRLDAAMARFGEAGLLGRYTIVEEARFRSRPLRS
jgi:predicted nuclease of predicted toxin-antitoxin system